jgi:hypothetical protein
MVSIFLLTNSSTNEKPIPPVAPNTTAFFIYFISISILLTTVQI